MSGFPRVAGGGGGTATRVAVEVLERLMRRALVRRGVSEEHAGWVAEGLGEASLRGVDTHGVRLFPTYLAELDGGRANARPQIERVRGARTGSGRAAVLLDAGGALGVVAGLAACRELVALAREHGAGAIAVRNSNHFGPASCFSLYLARHDVLGFACTNSDALVAPFGGTAALVGTNPLSVAARGEGEELFCADFATSQVSYSRVRNYQQRGQPLAPGWAVTAEGADAAAGGEVAALQPLGGYKGEGLGMLVEIFCAVLTGEPLDHELSHFYGEPYDTPRRVAHFFFGVDLAALGEVDAFRARLSRLLAAVRAQPGGGGVHVLAPGDPEAATAVERRREGIPLSATELEAFRRIDDEASEREGL